MSRSGLFAAAVLAGATVSQVAGAQNFNGTCTNVHYEGSRLVAVCLNALGVPNASSIDVRSCPPQAVANANGNLVCTAGGGYGRRGYGDPGYGYDRPAIDENDDDDEAPAPRYYRRY